MLAMSLSVLTACGESIGSVEPPVLTEPPSEFTRPCPRPVKLPERPLTQLEVETNWIEDRGRLISCSERHGALVEFYQDRDSRIMGND